MDAVSVKWLVWICLLLLPWSANAGVSARCNALTSSCLCEEPLDTTTVNIRGGGSNVAWPGVLGSNMEIDPLDSTVKSCFSKDLNIPPNSVASNAGAQLDAVTDSVLPVGNTVGHVVRRIGPQTGQFSTEGFAGNAGQTWCVRSYQRWDSTSDIPDRLQCIDANPAVGTCGEHGIYFTGHVCAPDANNCGTGGSPGACCSPFHEQYKVQTLGNINANIQMIASFPGSNDGTFDFGMDISAFFGPNTNVSAGPNSGGIKITDCMNSWCRFETCLDFSASGHGAGRHKVTVINTGATGERDMPGALSDGTQTSIAWNTGGFPNLNNADMFGQIVAGYGATHTRYFSHIILTNTSTNGDATPTFWPGCDSAIEPTCNDNAGIPAAPNNSGLAPWKHAFLPWLREKLWGHALHVAWR